MPRRREVPKREILPDPKFGSVDLSKFMNVIMESGKKAVAERISRRLLELPRVERATVRVHKKPPLPGEFRSFGVEITRP